MATTEHWEDTASGEKRKRTGWHRVAVFGQPATFIVENAKKGSLVQVEGALRTCDWTDKEGVKRYTTEVVDRQVQLLETRERPEEERQKTEEPPVERPEVEEDIPF